MSIRFSAALFLLVGCGVGAGTRIDRLPPDPASAGYRLLPRPVLLPRGETTYDCGPESLAAVLSYWGKSEDVTTLSRLLVNPQLKSTATPKIAPLVRKMGLNATYLPGSMALVKGSVDDGKPPIVAIRLSKSVFHYYVVSGYNDRLQSALCEERDGSKTLYTYETLDRLWRETGYFLLLVEPSTAASEYEKGADYEEVGNYERAEEHYRRALAGDPAFHEARLGLANCLVARGKLEEAATEYERVLKGMPSDPKARNNLAHVWCELGRSLERAEELAAGAVATLLAWRKESAADLAASKTDLDRQARSRDLEERRIELAYSYGTLGQIRFRRERFVAAVEAWEAALLEIPTGFPDFQAKRHYEVGLALQKLGRAEDARGRMEEARKLAQDPALRSKIDHALKN